MSQSLKVIRKQTFGLFQLLIETRSPPPLPPMFTLASGGKGGGDRGRVLLKNAISLTFATHVYTCIGWQGWGRSWPGLTKKRDLPHLCHPCLHLHRVARVGEIVAGSY